LRTAARRDSKGGRQAHTFRLIGETLLIVFRETTK
jgi:hypothetical protein